MLGEKEGKMTKGIFLTVAAAVIILISNFMTTGSAFADLVIKEGGKTYIVDRTGERWDVTQAASIGFNPEGFQFGLGKDAIAPLEAGSLSDDNATAPRGLRVIGVPEADHARAYSVQKLTRHEIANSMINSKPIAVGY